MRKLVILLASWISGAYRNTWSLLLVLSTLLVYLCTSSETPHREHWVQAQAYLSGHFYIDQWAYMIREKVQWQGHWYEVHPPLSALVSVLIPSQRVLACIAGTLAVVLMLTVTGSVWLTVFFGFGTNLWWAVSQNDPWNMTLLLGCLMITGAVWAVKNGHPLVAGLFAGCAGLARYDYIPVVGLLLVFYPQWCSTLLTLTSDLGDGGIKCCGSGIRPMHQVSDWTRVEDRSLSGIFP
jgi:hypothetical protein